MAFSFVDVNNVFNLESEFPLGGDGWLSSEAVEKALFRIDEIRLTLLLLMVLLVGKFDLISLLEIWSSGVNNASLLIKESKMILAVLLHLRKLKF